MTRIQDQVAAESFAPFRILGVLDRCGAYGPENGVSIRQVAEQAGVQPGDAVDIVEGLACGIFAVLPCAGTFAISPHDADPFGQRVYVETDPGEISAFAKRLHAEAERAIAHAAGLRRLARREATRQTGVGESEG